MTAVTFILGCIVGGFIGIALMCCLQINRISDYESEIQRLREKQNNK